jgi:acyl carrier protein
VEPDEIVAVLNDQPGVAASAVVTHGDTPGDARLVAYVVPTNGAPPPPAVLQAALRGTLPAYMVPSVFVRLDALPLTRNGKVDRAALPVPAEDNTLRDGLYRAPRTPLEARVASMVAGLLGLERVGVDDDFFRLGGHSLLGAQLIARVRDDFGIDLPLRAAFDSPTVAALAAEIERSIVTVMEMQAGDASPGLAA